MTRVGPGPCWQVVIIIAVMVLTEARSVATDAKRHPVKIAAMSKA